MQKNLRNTLYRPEGRLGAWHLALLLLAICAFSALLALAPRPVMAADGAITPSANGTRGSRVVDGGGAVWTFDGNRTLRNGGWVAGGRGEEYLYVNLSVYLITSEAVWRWHGSGWELIGRDIAGIVSGLVSSIGSSGGGVSSTAVRQVATEGSIAAGSNQLGVANASGFSVGDWVIVEIGQEPGRGQRGTRGVGGTWPSRSYATESQLLSEGGSNGQFAWAEDTGNVFWRGENMFNNGFYYLGKAIPRSLQARITEISGNRLTLNREAAVSVSGAAVHLDVAPILNQLIATGASVSLPAGRYATGGVLHIQDRGGFALSGQGKDQTTVFSPKGVPSAMIQVFNSPSTTIRDFTLQGNFRDQGLGLNWGGSTPPGGFRAVSDNDAPHGDTYPRGIFFTAGAQNGAAQDMRVVDVAQHAVGVFYAENVWARRVENVQNDLMRQYLSWQFQWSDTTGGGCEDCEVRSTYLIPAFESFRSANTQFVRARGTNALFAMNGAGGWFIDDSELRFTANSLLSGGAVTPFHPIVDITTNIGVTPQVSMGGTIRNLRMIQDDYVNAANDTLGGIRIQENTPDIRIESSFYSAPDYLPTGITYGAIGLHSKGANTTVNGMRVVGKAIPHLANIDLERGSGQGCVAEVVRGCSR